MPTLRIERRLHQPRWLTSSSRSGSLLVAFGLIALVLLATHHPPGHTFARLVRLGLRRPRPARLDADRGDAAHLHRPLRRGRLPHEPLQHRRRGPALRRCDRRRRGRDRARQHLGAALDRGDDRRRRRRRSGLRADPGRPAGVPLDQRDHHLADAQLRRRARPQLPDLRLASRTGATPRRPTRASSRRARRCPTPRAGPCVDLFGLAVPLGFLLAAGVAVVGRGPLRPHAVRVRGEGDRRLAAGGDATRGCGRAGRSSP